MCTPKSFRRPSLLVPRSAQRLSSRQPHYPLSPYIAQPLKSPVRVSPGGQPGHPLPSHTRQHSNPCKVVSPISTGLSTLLFTSRPLHHLPYPVSDLPASSPQTTLLHSSWINRSHNCKEPSWLLATTSAPHLATTSAFVLGAMEDSLSCLRPGPVQPLWVLPPLAFPQTRPRPRPRPIPITHALSLYEITNLPCVFDLPFTS